MRHRAIPKTFDQNDLSSYYVNLFQVLAVCALLFWFIQMSSFYLLIPILGIPWLWLCSGKISYIKDIVSWFKAPFSYQQNKADAIYNNYRNAVRDAYWWSIKEALKTEYPHGIVYILENTLQELEKFELNLNPDSRYHQHNRYGFPNKTNLKEAIKMAQMLSKNWEELESYDSVKSSQAMAEIRARVKQEEFYLWTDIQPLRDRDIYWFSYGKEDYDAEGSLNNSPKPSNVTTEDRNTDAPYFNNYPEQNPVIAEDNQTEEPYFKNISNPNLLSFNDWLTENDALQYVSSEEQKKAYQRYVQSCHN